MKALSRNVPFAKGSPVAYIEGAASTTLPPGKKLIRLCRTMDEPGDLRVPLQEPMRLVEESSSAWLVTGWEAQYPSTPRRPKINKARIPCFPIFPSDFTPPFLYYAGGAALSRWTLHVGPYWKGDHYYDANIY